MEFRIIDYFPELQIKIIIDYLLELQIIIIDYLPELQIMIDYFPKATDHSY